MKVGNCFKINLENFPELEPVSLPQGHAVATLKACNSPAEDLNVQKAAWRLAGLKESSGQFLRSLESVQISTYIQSERW